ncbi:MAG: Na+/H+ antiporter NhaA [Flavobacterium sp.]|nr:MAG: Na+/H+ antiporter NhaA [Flavobacterium sp.]
MENKIKISPVDKWVINPFGAFVSNSIMGGVVLLICAVIAIGFANSPLSEWFLGLWEHKIGIGLNNKLFLNYSIQHWINDGVIAIFFFVLGLELKREILGGQLTGLRNAMLPIVVGLGGMLFPALLFLLFNGGTETSHGWGIPMATDIAFALGVLYLLGDRIPPSVKIFLTAFAIIDDLGAIMVIALFYTSEISFIWLGVGVFFLLVLMLANKAGVRNTLFYGIIGIGIVWLAFLLSGVHATIAAVLVAFTIPADAKVDEKLFLFKAKKYATKFNDTDVTDTPILTDEQLHILKEMKTITKHAMTPLQRLEHDMHPIVSFVVMPLFALANAGVVLNMNLGELFSTNIFTGVVVGLILGKFIGIFGLTYVLVKLKVFKLPRAMNFKHLFGVSIISGIGFTMSIFITSLAYTNEAFITQAKIGIFVASIIAGTVGYIYLSRLTPPAKPKKMENAPMIETLEND